MLVVGFDKAQKISRPGVAWGLLISSNNNLLCQNSIDERARNEGKSNHVNHIFNFER